MGGQCFTVEPISFTYCSGECGSGAYFHEETGQLIQRCTCCRPTSYRNATVQAKCLDDQLIDVTYTMITSCSCDVNLTCSEGQNQGVKLAQPIYNAQGEFIDTATAAFGGHNLGQIGLSDPRGGEAFAQELASYRSSAQEMTAALRQCFDGIINRPSSTSHEASYTHAYGPEIFGDQN